MYKTVKVEWNDSRQIHGWTLEEDIDHSVCHVCSCGYLINDTEDAITVAVSVGFEPLQANGVNVIPKCCITKYEEI